MRITKEEEKFKQQQLWLHRTSFEKGLVKKSNTPLLSKSDCWFRHRLRGTCLYNGKLSVLMLRDSGLNRDIRRVFCLFEIDQFRGQLWVLKKHDRLSWCFLTVVCWSSGCTSGLKGLFPKEFVQASSLWVRAPTIPLAPVHTHTHTHQKRHAWSQLIHFCTSNQST